MLTHTTARGLQQELVRRHQRPQWKQSDRALSSHTVNWRRLGATVAAGVAAIAIVAASVNTADSALTDPVLTDPVPVVKTVEDAFQVNVSTPAEEIQGGTSGVPLMAN